MQKITPFLWFNDRAEEAMNFYTTVFRNSKIVSMNPGPGGAVMSGTIELEGQRFMAFNGGPMFTFSPAISLFVDCKTQDEVDYYWDKLSEGGQKSRCGWLTDKFGMSWQIVPTVLSEVLYGKDAAGSKRAMQAMLKMDKLDIRTLKEAYDGVTA